MKKMNICEKCGKKVEEELGLIMEKDSSELFVCKKCIEIRRKEYEEEENISKNYLIYYNEEVLRIRSIIDKVYLDLEKEGIIIRMDLKMEIESEVLDIEMNKYEVKLGIIEYIRKILSEE